MVGLLIHLFYYFIIVFRGADGGQTVQTHWIETDLKVTNDLLLLADGGESSAGLFLDLKSC